MEGWGLQLCALLLLSLWAPVPAASLAGSCVDAGFAECCDLSVQEDCFAMPTFCLCDPSCRDYNDCCDDIDKICPPAPVAPELLLSVSTTHHTASLLWVLPEKAATNDTYSIVYWEHESPNSTLTRYNISSSSESRSGEFVLARLIGLGPGLLYEWAVETSNGIMTSQSAISSLTTQHVGELEGLSAELYNASSVLVTWLPPQLPCGVQLHEYTVHYAATTTPSISPHVVETGWVTVPGNHAILTGLSSDLFYHISVEAVVLDDVLWSGDYVHGSNATVFVPDSTIVQLRGGPFRACSSWTQEFEEEVLDTFRSLIYKTIHRESSVTRGQNCDGRLIESDLVLCDISSSSGESHAIYRATVYSTPNYTTEMLTGLLEELVSTTELHDFMQLDTACPLRLHITSEPLCSSDISKQPTPTTGCPRTDPRAASSNCSCEKESEGTTVTLPVLATALVAELLLIVFVAMVFTAIYLLVRRRRYLADVKLSENTTSHTTEANAYS